MIIVNASFARAQMADHSCFGSNSSGSRPPWPSALCPSVTMALRASITCTVRAASYSMDTLSDVIVVTEATVSVCWEGRVRWGQTVSAGPVLAHMQTHLLAGGYKSSECVRRSVQDMTARGEALQHAVSVSEAHKALTRRDDLQAAVQDDLLRCGNGRLVPERGVVDAHRLGPARALRQRLEYDGAAAVPGEAQPARGQHHAVLRAHLQVLGCGRRQAVEHEPGVIDS
jgi:hypothetical protein